MKFLKDLSQKKLAKAVVCGLMVSGGMVVGMGQAFAAAPVTGRDGSTYNCSTLNDTSTATALEGVTNFNFYIPATANHADSMLIINEISGSSYVSYKFAPGTTINAGVQTGSKLRVGNVITLMANVSAPFTSLENISTRGILTESDYKEFGLVITDEAGGHLIAARVTSVPGTNNPTNDGGHLTEESKSPVETQAAGLTLLTTGADMLASQGFDNASTAVANEVGEGGSANVMTPFAAVGGAKSKVKSGSHVDVKGWNLNVGLAKEIKNKAGKLLIGPVVEYGKGSYDSYLDNGYHGEGDTKYIGGGIMAKQTNDNGFYYEGSLRVGKLDNDYKARVNSYDSDATYYAAHIGVGKIVKLSDKNTLDYYGKYFYTHQKGDNTTLHAGGVDYDLSFDSVKSNRTRIGGRFTHAMSEKDSIYVGLAWQHEFSGTARATIDGAGTPAPTVKGNTGIMELGWKVNANKNLDLDLGATAYTGKQKGASLNLAMNFKF